jgi:DNA-binding XRE family transcriptional regulator
MAKKQRSAISCARLELEGVRYVILREAVFDQLCRKAKVSSSAAVVSETSLSSALQMDGPSLAEKLIERRRAAGLSQAELARRAGVRCETLNRIERGKTTPDFATVRKLVVAMNAAEQETADL